MGKGIFLVNTELDKDNVDVIASSELGRRGGAPIPFDTNSGLMIMNAIGDAGDDLDHDVVLYGGQTNSRYSPLTDTLAIQYTDPEAFATLPIVASTALNQFALATADDQLYAIVATATDLNVFRWTGSTWSLKATITGAFDDSDGGIAVCQVGKHIYIAVADVTNQNIVMLRYTTRKETLSIAAESFVSTVPLTTVHALALASSGASFLLLVDHNGVAMGATKDVTPFFGTLGSMRAHQSINTHFSTIWTTGGYVHLGALAYSSVYGYIAAFRVSNSSPGDLKVATTPHGNTWTEFLSINDVISQPTTATPWASGSGCGLALDGRRVFIFRSVAAVLNDPPSNILLQWFNGSTVWSAEVVAAGAIAVDANSPPVSATVWRGRIFFGWRSSATQMAVRKCNLLTTTATATTHYLEFTEGEPAFVAGIDDDTRIALFFVATGSVVAGDRWRIPSAEYDYRVKHLLDDFMSKMWRGEQNQEQIIQFDAGSGRGFSVDTIALFRSNLPSITVEMDDDVAFGTPPVSQVLSATIQTATVTSASRNRVDFAPGTFEDRKYSGGLAHYWVKFSVGATLRILDNTDDALIVDGSATGSSGTATIFRDSMGYMFNQPQGPYRYLRLVTPVVVLPVGYYRISRVLFGLRFVPTIDYRIEWQRRYGQQMARMDLKDGGRFNTLLNVHQRPAWTLTFRHTYENVSPVANFFGRAQGGVSLLGFWPDATVASGDNPVVFPMSFTTDAPELSDLGGEAAELTVTLEGQI